MVTWKHQEIQELFEALNDFSTAPAALSKIFDASHGENEAILIQKILLLQCEVFHCNLNQVIQSFDTSDANIIQKDKINEFMVFRVMGKPVLTFATSIYDEELALLILNGLIRFKQVCPKFDLLRQVLDNSTDSHGFSSLHYAVEGHMIEYFTQVIDKCICAVMRESANAADHIVKLLGAIRTFDVVLPVSGKQVTGRMIESDGRTVLHLAARRGELNIVKLLLQKARMIQRTADFDGNTAYMLASIHGHTHVTRFIEEFNDGDLFLCDSNGWQILRAHQEEVARQRYLDSLQVKPPMTQVTTFSNIWTKEECTQVLTVLEKIAAKYGWCTQRHAAYPTTDLPCYRVTPIDEWVRKSVETRLFPQIHAQYAISPNDMITFRELFYVKYEAKQGERAELGLHCDGSVLSFNILINYEMDFEGGGTYFEETKEIIKIRQGDAVAHSGKVKHAGATVKSGIRIILVGFLDIVPRTPLYEKKAIE